MSSIQINSVYIPRVAAHHSADFISIMMSQFGTVERIDFTPINKKPGFRENVDNGVKSVFVHFSSRGFANCFWSIIDREPSTAYQLTVSQDEYWLCLKNRSPVQRTMMNIHQVVENGRHLEGLLERQASIIQKQEDKINELEKKLERTSNVVYQLIGGLFNQRDQSDVIDHHLAHLFGRQIPAVVDENKSSIWPTTRQGDYCERRIAELEKTIQQNNLNQEVKELEQQVKRNRDAVYQLIGGLFNQRTQSDVIDLHLAHLCGYPIPDVDEEKLSIWPTTRQGDDCERRIATLEEILNIQQNKEECLENISDEDDEDEEQDSALLSKKHSQNKDLANMSDKELEYYYYQMSEEESDHKRIKEAKKRVRDARGY